MVILEKEACNTKLYVIVDEKNVEAFDPHEEYNYIDSPLNPKEGEVVFLVIPNEKGFICFPVNMNAGVQREK